MSKMTGLEFKSAAYEEVLKRTLPSCGAQLILVLLTVVMVLNEGLFNSTMASFFGLLGLILGFRGLLGAGILRLKRINFWMSFLIISSSVVWSVLMAQLLLRGTGNISATLGGIILAAGLTAGASYSLGPAVHLLYTFNTILCGALMGVLVFHLNELHIQWPVLLYFLAYWVFTLRTGKIAFEEWKAHYLSRAELQAVVDAFPGGVSLLSDNHYILANAWIKEHLGIDPNDIIGKPLGVRGDNQGFVQQVIDFNQSESMHRQFEMPLVTPQGVRRHIVIFKKLRMRSPEILTVTLDIEEQKKTELELDKQRLQLVASAKMASLGEMSSGIAHEINNPLTIIMSQIELLQRKLHRENTVSVEIVETVIGKIEKMGLRISRIIKGLQHFAQDTNKDSMEIVDLNGVIQETLSLCGARFREAEIDIQIDVDSNLNVFCRATQLSQVLLILLNNAFDAVQKSQDKWVQIKAESFDDRIDIKVKDSGHGIPADLKDKIMLPFFTTKPPGKGTGLGLSIAHGLMASQKGQLSLDTESEQTCFVVSLPQTPANFNLKKHG